MRAVLPSRSPRCTGSPTARPGARHAALGRPGALQASPGRAAGGGGPADRRHRHRLMGGRLRAARRVTARCWATRCTTGTNAPTGCRRVFARWPRRAVRAHRHAAAAVQHASSNSPPRAARPRSAAAHRLLLIPDLLALLADRRRRRRGHQRLHDRVLDVGTRLLGPGPAGRLASAADLCRRCVEPGDRSGRCPRSGLDRAGRSRWWRSARTTPRRPWSACPAAADDFAYISCGTWSLVGVELTAPVLTGAQPRGELHQRARRRRHGPLPAQRHGPVAAAGVACGPGRAGRSGPADAARGGGAACRRCRP